MDKAKTRVLDRKKRAARIRKKISGTPERPRMCVRRSLNHIYAQVIDDLNQKTIALVGSRSKEVAEKIAAADKGINKSGISRLVGETIAEKAKSLGIEKVVFDRKGYAYHGRIKALADGARAKGLVF